MAHLSVVVVQQRRGLCAVGRDLHARGQPREERLDAGAEPAVSLNWTIVKKREEIEDVRDYKLSSTRDSRGDDVRLLPRVIMQFLQELPARVQHAQQHVQRVERQRRIPQQQIQEFCRKCAIYSHKLRTNSGKPRSRVQPAHVGRDEGAAEIGDLGGETVVKGLVDERAAVDELLDEKCRVLEELRSGAKRERWPIIICHPHTPHQTRTHARAHSYTHTHTHTHTYTHIHTYII
jgi:hypothetical protein